MFLLLIVYIDAFSLKILNLGGEILNLAIVSGFAFAIVMILIIFIEKEICRRDDKKSKNNSVKAKVKCKFKESLKKIAEKEIDKRL